MEDNIWCIGNTLFYVPNYPLDLIQSAIVNEDKYYEMDILQDLDKYIPDNAVIFDVGANIGNHSLYWAIERRAKKIYAFEPVAQIFKMLTKNIAINNLENVVEPLNIGLSNVKTKGRVSGFWQDNIAKTQVEGSQFGSLNLDMLDNIDIAESKIDFIKIDVEEHEILTLNGALKTLSKYRPLIFIESFDPHIVEVRKIMDNLGYKLIKEYPGSNYLFAHKEKSKGLI